VRSFKSARIVVPLVFLAASWWAQPEEFAALLRSGFVVNVGSSDQPHELFAPAAAIVLVPLALRFGLPLILRAALLLPFAATALSSQMGRRATFDPARDLPADSFLPGSKEEIAVDRAIAMALTARNRATVAESQAQPPAIAMAEQTSVGAARPPAKLFGRHDAAA
jgi:hypothetical protein